MNPSLTIAALIASAAISASADKPTDLTGAGPDGFKALLGKVVALRGRLEQGMQGPCLFGSTPTNVVFYVIPDMPSSGVYTYPVSWERLMHKQVRVSGVLRFRSIDRPVNDARLDRPAQIPPDYNYMVLQRTTLEGPDPK